LDEGGKAECVTVEGLFHERVEVFLEWKVLMDQPDLVRVLVEQSAGSPMGVTAMGTFIVGELKDGQGGILRSDPRLPFGGEPRLSLEGREKGIGPVIGD